MSNHLLSILFTKDGFSFCVFKNGKRKVTEHFSLDISSEHALDSLIHDRIKNNLYWKQTYDQVNVAVLSEQFNLVPNEYWAKNDNAEEWLAFNANIYEGDSICTTPIEEYDAQLVYSYPHELDEVVSTYFKEYNLQHTASLMLNQLKSQSDTPEFFVQYNAPYLNILCVQEKKLLFYNHFYAPTKEDVVYYILNTYKLLELDTNQHHLYYFGDIHKDEKMLKMLLNFVRHVMPGTEDTDQLLYFTHYKNQL